jgi:hypothetical protein
MPRSLVVIAVLISSVALLANAPARAFDVTECHQTVPSREKAVLQTDLVCDGSGGPNLNLGYRSRLELNGHSISGGYIGISVYPGPGAGQAVIVGPGEIFGADSDPFGAAIAPQSRVMIRNVTLRDNRRGILAVYNHAMKLDDVTIVDNTAQGISSYLGASGPGKGRIRGRNLTVSGNGDNGIEAFGRLLLRDSTVSGNGGTGILVHDRFTLQNVGVTGNAGAGVASTSSKRGKLKSSTATGNGAAGDIAAPVAPRLIASTCDDSVDTDDGGTLGICAND